MNETKTTASRWPTFLTDIGMLVLTAMIVVSVIGQTFLMYKQSAILAEADRREQDRLKPNLIVKRWIHHTLHEKGEAIIFTVTNASPFAVYITDMELVVAVEADHERWRTRRGAIFMPRAYRTRNGAARAGTSEGLTQRLEYGESISDGFDVDTLIERLSTEAGYSILVRFECRDSLGNIYVSDGWYVWERDASGSVNTTVHDNPGRGVVAPNNLLLLVNPWSSGVEGNRDRSPYHPAWGNLNN